MASRAERFERRIRGAGVRQLEDDDFGFALPGLAPERAPGTPSQRAKPTTPRLSSKAAKKGPPSQARRKTASELNTVIEGNANRADEDGNISKKRRISPGGEEAQSQPTDLDLSSQQADSSALQNSTAGKKRKRRKSIVQKPARKSRESRDPEHSIVQEEPQQDISTSAANEVDDLEKEIHTKSDETAKNVEESSELATKEIESESVAQLPLNTEELTVDDAPITNIPNASSQDETETQEQVPMLEDSTQSLTNVNNGSNDITNDLGDVPVGAEEEATQTFTDATMLSQDQLPIEQHEASEDISMTTAPGVAAAARDLPVRQLNNDAGATETRPRRGSKSARKDRLKATAEERQPDSFDETREASRPDAIRNTQSDDNIPKRRGRPQKKMLTSVMDSQPRPKVGSSEQERLVENKSSTGKKRGRPAKSATTAEPNTDAGRRPADGEASPKPRKRQRMDHDNEPEPPELHANTVQFPTTLITIGDFPSPILRNEAQGSSRMPPLISANRANRANPTASDVLAQASTELITSTIAKVEREVSKGKIEKAASKRIRGVIQAFGRELRSQLHGISRLVGQNEILARRVKHSRQARKEVVGEIMEVRRERDDIEDEYSQSLGRLALAKKVGAEDEKMIELLKGLRDAVKTGKSRQITGEEMTGSEFFRRLSKDNLIDV